MTGGQTSSDDALAIPSPQPVRDAASGDPLLAAFIELADANGIRTSARALTAGLGLDGDPVDRDTLDVMAQSLGLRVIDVGLKGSRSLSKVSLPLASRLKDGRSLIIETIEGQQAVTFDPARGERETLPLNVLTAELSENAFSLVFDDNAASHGSDGASRRGHWFWRTLFAAKGQYLKVVLASFIVNTLAIAAPLFTLNVYDRVLPNSAFSTLWVLAIGMGLVLIFDLAFRALRGAIVDSAGRWADVKLASTIFDHVLRMDLSERPARAGEFANRLRDFETVRDFFSSATVIAVLDLIFVVLFLFTIYLVGGPMVYLPIAAVVIVLSVGIVVQPLMMKNVRDVQEEAALKHGLLIEAINNLPTIKSLNAEDHFLRRWQTYVGRTARSSEKVRLVSQNLINVTLIVQQSVTVGLIIMGTYLFDQGLLSMGAIIAVVMLASRAIAPLASIAGTLSRLQQSLVSLRNLNDIMSARLENEAANDGIARSLKSGAIALQGVGLTYPQSEAPALSEVTLSVPAGSRVGIIGKVGAGKSTFVGLLAGLYKPSLGTIAIDGVNLSQLHTRDLRDHLGHVGQDTALFAGTVRDNIVMGAPHVSDAEIEQAAQLTGASDFIDANPFGYGLDIGEGGRRLSGGQRQLLALTRALVRDPSIIVLDEPTSAMDMASEAAFLKKLDTAAKGRTLIVSTHRHSVLSIVDTLLVLDNGRVAAFGPKESVLKLLAARADANRQQGSAKVVPLSTPQTAGTS